MHSQAIATFRALLNKINEWLRSQLTPPQLHDEILRLISDDSGRQKLILPSIFVFLYKKTQLKPLIGIYGRIYREGFLKLYEFSLYLYWLKANGHKMKYSARIQAMTLHLLGPTR